MKKIILFSSLLLINFSFASEFQAEIKNILKNYGLERINTHFDREEVTRQQQLNNNRIQFNKALKMALESFIQDDEDMESPKALLIEFAFEELEMPFDFPYPAEVQIKSEEMVKKFMLDKSSLLELQELNIPAENGETPHDFWIFRLYMGSLSDHQYWAIIDRQGNIKPYNYGFN